MAREIILDGKRVDDDADCYVIAEVGHNHQGEMAKARQLFEEAAECGVDAVKLQKRDNRSLFTTDFFNKPYDHENSFGKTYGAHREFLEFGKQEYAELAKYAKELGMHFFATAFDIPSADLLNDLGMPFFKVSSADLQNFPLTRHIAGFGKPMILSTGGATFTEIRYAIDQLAPINDQLVILLCTSTYPTLPENMYLRAIPTLREMFPEFVIGLSDHYDGILTSSIAYTLGARVVEKHFTLHHSWKGTDHAFSLEPGGMRRMVRDLRRTRLALGTGDKPVTDEERGKLAKMAKSIVAAENLAEGTVLSMSHLAFKSPGGGLLPRETDKLLGCRINKAIAAEQPITFDDVVSS